MDFFEWVQSFLDFCLGNEQFLYKFIFRLIDMEHKELISLSDLYKFLQIKRNGMSLFPKNFLK